MAGGERRKEPRYVVDAVNLLLGDRSHPVIDISISGARISCPPREYERAASGRAILEFNQEGQCQVFEIQPHVLRKAELYVVLTFEPPQADWESFIRQFDTFHVHELDERLFG